MVNESIVETMIKRINHKLAIRHQKHMLVCPTKIQVRSRMPHLVYLGENLLTRQGCLGNLRQSLILPDLPCVLIPVLHYRAVTNNENRDDDGNRKPDNNLAANRSALSMRAHVA